MFQRAYLIVFTLQFFYGGNRVINHLINFAKTATRRAQTRFTRMRNIAHQISGRAAASPARAHGYFALFYKRKDAGQGVFDGFRATIINIAPKSNRIGDVTPTGCAGLLKLAQQKSLVGGIWKKHLDRFDMRPGHGENMGRALDYAPVKGWLRRLPISAPSSAQTSTACELGGCPRTACTPADATSMSLRFPKRRRKRPSAMGLRQTLPVQTKRTLFTKCGRANLRRRPSTFAQNYANATGVYLTYL